MEVLSFPAFSKQLRTEGSIFEPPKAATSPSWRGTWMQSCKSSPNLRWSTKRLGSAISRNKSRNHAISNYNWNAIYVIKSLQIRKPICEVVHSSGILYSHLYFSSRCPLQSNTSPTLKDKTRICPVRWLKGNKMKDTENYEQIY